VIVTDNTGTITIQFDNTQMAVINRNTNVWLAYLRGNPDRLRRHVARGLLNLSETDVFERIRERVQRGFMGELATAEYLGVPYHWELRDIQSDEFDVAGIQVRTVDDYNKRLITHEYDKPAPYVLAVADYGTASVVLRGWLHLRDCNRPEHWFTGTAAPAFFTPATALHPMATLPTPTTKATVTNGI